MTTKEKMSATVEQLIRPAGWMYIIVALLTINEPKPGISLGELMIYIPIVILLIVGVLGFFRILFLAFEDWANKIIDIWVK